jgi:hypothetical protein
MKLPAASVEMMVWVEKRVSPLRSLPKAQTAPVEMTVRVGRKQTITKTEADPRFAKDDN